MLPLSPTMRPFRKLHARVGGIVGELYAGKLNELNSANSPKV